MIIIHFLNKEYIFLYRCTEGNEHSGYEIRHNSNAVISFPFNIRVDFIGNTHYDAIKPLYSYAIYLAVHAYTVLSRYIELFV